MIREHLTSFPKPNLSDLSVACLGDRTCNRSNNIIRKGGPQTVVTICSKKRQMGLYSAESASRHGCPGQKQSSTTALEDGNGGESMSLM